MRVFVVARQTAPATRKKKRMAPHFDLLEWPLLSLLGVKDGYGLPKNFGSLTFWVGFLHALL